MNGGLVGGCCERGARVFVLLFWFDPREEGAGKSDFSRSFSDIWWSGGIPTEGTLVSRFGFDLGFIEPSGRPRPRRGGPMYSSGNSADFVSVCGWACTGFGSGAGEKDNELGIYPTKGGMEV